MATNVRNYTDFDISFVPHPITGDIGILSNADAIKNSLKGLILTSVGDRAFHPEISCMVNSLLFEIDSPFTGINVQRTIHDVIKNFEPRVNLISVAVTPNLSEKSIAITVTFQIVNSSQIYTFNQTIQSVR